MNFKKIAYPFRKNVHNTLQNLQNRTPARYSIQVSLIVIAVLSTAFLFPSSETFQFSNLAEGDIYTGDEIIAPFTFYINKSENEISKDRKAAAEKIPLVFIKADGVAKKSLVGFDKLFEDLDKLVHESEPDSTIEKHVRTLLEATAVVIEQAHLSYLIDTPIPNATPSEVKKSVNRKKEYKKSIANFRQQLRRLLLDVQAIGLLNRNRSDVPSHVKKLAIISSQGEVLESSEPFLRLDTYHEILIERLRQLFKDNDISIKMGYPIITAFLKPNYIFDQQTTEKRTKQAIANVALSKGIVLESERIISPHDKVTTQVVEKLTSLASTQLEQELQEGGLKLLLPYIGRLLTISLILSLSIFFLKYYRKNYTDDLKRNLMLFTIFMFMLGATFFINTFGLPVEHKYVTAVPLTAMLLTIFFDNRTAFIATISMSAIVATMHGNDFPGMMVTMFAGIVSTFAVREIQARNWILKAIFYLAASYILSVTAFELLRHTSFDVIWDMWNYALVVSLLSPILAYGLMLIFEFFFQVTTDSTLLELSDLNKPLLRELAIRAPGSYHHSIMVGNLSESASEAIGANALLARVASYYHDIGKMEKPEYFVENQKAGKNPHEKLTPTMSCLILINHVKRGLEVAEKYNLPRIIREFIPQHHGTNLIRFFYKKAIELNGEVEIDRSNFCYPGPKPQTREAGIVMLADSIEAGSRALKDPSANRIRSLIDTIIQERLLEGELDECPLTISELKIIKESFVKTVTAMFHGRIKYPKIDEKVIRKPRVQIV